uniref:Uncharacterized protein n=1 Tax=Branchiostoma floridae TaxID=7739 RepID=C3YP78_BRAFL|eukprot:XP_002601957.1 hypothetical protein BRAFLDRAFT_86441 [Branchiostoma floridae]
MARLIYDCSALRSSSRRQEAGLRAGQAARARAASRRKPEHLAHKGPHFSQQISPRHGHKSRGGSMGKAVLTASRHQGLEKCGIGSVVGIGKCSDALITSKRVLFIRNLPFRPIPGDKRQSFVSKKPAISANPGDKRQSFVNKKPAIPADPGDKRQSFVNKKPSIPADPGDKRQSFVNKKPSIPADPGDKRQSFVNTKPSIPADPGDKRQSFVNKKPAIPAVPGDKRQSFVKKKPSIPADPGDKRQSFVNKKPSIPADPGDKRQSFVKKKPAIPADPGDKRQSFVVRKPAIPADPGDKRPGACTNSSRGDWRRGRPPALLVRMHYFVSISIFVSILFKMEGGSARKAIPEIPAGSHPGTGSACTCPLTTV